MTLAELRRWTMERNWSEARRKNFDEFITEEYGVVYADSQLCEIWARVKSESRKSGKPVATEDAWIAAVALMFDIPLVTHNRKHFQNINGIKIVSED